jgi:hypothetical protein
MDLYGEFVQSSLVHGSSAAIGTGVCVDDREDGSAARVERRDNSKRSWVGKGVQ